MTLAQLKSVQKSLKRVADSLLADAYEDARPLLPIAVELAFACFGDIREISCSRDSDPETGMHWTELRVEVALPVNEATEAFSNFTRRWVAAVPWPDHHLIGLSLNLI